MHKIILGTLAIACAACSSRVPLYAPVATLGNTLQVRTFDAYARGDRVFVKTIVTNVSGQPVVIDRDGFSLRLPDGETLPRGSGTTTQHKPYPVAPGAGREVFVDFRAAHELEHIGGATVIVGGISIGADPRPQVVGEIPLSVAPAQ
jgi:hypothetical protein